VNDAASELRDKWLPSLQVLGRLGMTAQEMQTLGGRYVLVTGDDESKEVMERMRAALAAYENARREYGKLAAFDEERHLVGALDAAWATVSGMVHVPEIERPLSRCTELRLYV
jgi:hypothetical protein